MGRRRCCCGCLIFADNFNRPNSTDLGINWTEYGGDWQIVSNRLKEVDGVYDALVICDQVHPKMKETMTGEVKCINLANGKSYLYIVNFVDTSNYNFAALTCAGGSFTISVWTVIGGTKTHLDSVSGGGFTPGDDILLEVCHNRGGLQANYGSAVAWKCLPDNAALGYLAGLGNGSAGGETVEFDDFEYREHHITRAECPTCVCDCDDFCVRKTLTLTFVATGICSCLDGAEIPLTETGDHNWPCIWEGEANLCDWTGQGGPAEPFGYRLTSGGSCGSWELCNTESPPAGPDECPLVDNPYNCTCNPFYLRFGPYHDSVSEVGDCDYWIVITEAP